MNQIGIMQGRLIPDENRKIQSFPRKNWRKEFPLMEKLGLTILEWTVDHTCLWDNPILTKNGLLEINQLKDFYKIEILTATADNLMQAPIHKSFEGNQTTYQECVDFLGALDLAGIKILVWPLIDSGNIASKTEFEVFQQKMSKICEFLRTIDIKVAFETDMPPEYNLKLINSLNSNSIGINYDIGNSASFGFSVSHEFSVLKNLIIHLHVKDRIFRGHSVPLGTGDVNWGEVSLELANNYNGIKILQTARKQNNLIAIEEYLRFCERIGI